MKQNKASIFHVQNLQMPLKLLAVAFFDKIFPLRNAGNLRLVLLPMQFNRVSDKFTLTFELSAIFLQQSDTLAITLFCLAIYFLREANEELSFFSISQFYQKINFQNK
jgi:hypothetical protein